MASRPALVLAGASGHAKVVIDVIEREGKYRIAQLLDDDASLHGSEFFGYQVTGTIESIATRVPSDRPLVLVSIGSNAARTRIAAQLRDRGFALARAVHPHAQIGRDTTIGAGTVVMAGAVVNSGTTIGENAIVNTGATVDHDCSLGDGVHIAPGAHLCGGVRVGAGSFIGAGTVIVPGVRVGANAVIGAGSTVLEDVSDSAKVAGSPARRLA